MPQNSSESAISKQQRPDFTRLARSLNDQFALYLSKTADFVPYFESKITEQDPEIEEKHNYGSLERGSLDEKFELGNKLTSTKSVFDEMESKQQIKALLLEFKETIQNSRKILTFNTLQGKNILSMLQSTIDFELENETIINNLNHAQENLQFPSSSKLLREIFEKAEIQSEKTIAIISKIREIEMRTTLQEEEIAHIVNAFEEADQNFEKLQNSTSKGDKILSQFATELEKLLEINLNIESAENV